MSQFLSFTVTSEKNFATLSKLGLINLYNGPSSSGSPIRDSCLGTDKKGLKDYSGRPWILIWQHSSDTVAWLDTFPKSSVIFFCIRGETMVAGFCAAIDFPLGISIRGRNDINYSVVLLLTSNVSFCSP